jgi:predicted dehydrogenase
MKKIALIGVGRWGKNLQAELSKLAEIKYICDSKTELEPVLSDPEIEAVFIATPTETHFELAKGALEAGKHVFLEKPGTTSSVDLEKLVNLAETKGLKLAIGYEFPHHPAARKLKELMKNKKVRNIFFDWQKWGTFKDDSIKHLFCHEVSIAKLLGLEVMPHLLQKIRVISDSDIVEIESENIKFRINRASSTKQKTVTVLTDNGNYVWSNNELFEIVGEELKKIEISNTTPVAAELKDFLGSDKPLCDGQFALEVYKVIESVQA